MQKESIIFVLSSLILLFGCSDETITIEEGPRAILIDGSGTYSREISTEVERSQTFLIKGSDLLGVSISPESIASYQEAARLDPMHPMPHWGMAHAMGPNPNSRYENAR